MPCFNHDYFVSLRIILRLHFIFIVDRGFALPCLTIQPSGYWRIARILFALFPAKPRYYTALHGCALAIAEDIERQDDVDILLSWVVTSQFKKRHWHEVASGEHCLAGSVDKVLNVHYSTAILCGTSILCTSEKHHRNQRIVSQSQPYKLCGKVRRVCH